MYMYMYMYMSIVMCMYCTAWLHTYDAPDIGT